MVLAVAVGVLQPLEPRPLQQRVAMEETVFHQALQEQRSLGLVAVLAWVHLRAALAALAAVVRVLVMLVTQIQAAVALVVGQQAATAAPVL